MMVLRMLREFDESATANVFWHSVSTWALEEARRRLEAEGILPDPEKK
jgi:hypothetical protein